MSTPNFSYKNRCIVATDEDYKNGNSPTLEGTDYGTWSYPAIEIAASEYGGRPAPNYHAIVLAPGYYCDACIDFVETGYSIADRFEYFFEPETAREAIEALAEESGLSRYRVAKLAGRLDGRDIWVFWEAACEAVDEYLKEQEREVCNAICDHIKNAYGFPEYKLDVIFSNGEALYSEVG